MRHFFPDAHDAWTILARACLALVAGILLVPATASADSWLPPGERTYASDDGRWRLTVTPRPIAGAFAYFQDKVDGLDDAGGIPGEADHALARMERRDGRRWVDAWRGPLVNDVAPVDALVSPAGQVVTFDNWHSRGHGGDAVVIYDAQGRLVRAMGLGDFLPKGYVEALPYSVSSINWGHDHYVSDDGRELVLRVAVPDDRAGIDAREHVEVRFDLATGVGHPVAGPAWERALASARQVAAERREQRRQWRAAAMAPLHAPDASATAADWGDYLRSAFHRLEGDAFGVFPMTYAIAAPDDEHHRRTVDWLRNALVERCGQDCIVMTGSPSQAALVAALEEIGAELAPGVLQGGRVYIAVDDAHAEAARLALAHAGPTWIRIDPGQPIPQRKERLEKLAEEEAREAGEIDAGQSATE